MTVTPNKAAEVTKPDLVTLTIDDVEVSVAKETLVIRAAEQLGVQIPRFCDHPLLAPVGACRQCLVEVVDAGNGRPIPKPQASCTLAVAEGMVVKTQATSPVADKAQQGIMEFLLINHPLDCPVCDKGGECPLQNQAMSNGRGESRYVEEKRTFPKPINISAQVLLDRERCILCARCTRFSEQIAGDPFIAMIERGALQQVGIYEEEPFESYFSGNTIQICPVGALTSASYRFRSRPFDLVSTPSVCEHCASGCELRTDHRRGKVMRRLAGFDAEVNEEWNCDKGRFAFMYARQPDRLTHPLVRDEDTNELRPASWPEAFIVAARGLQAAAGSVGVLTGGRLTAEDAYAYSTFARVALGTNDIDFRSRPHSAEEAEFLASTVAATSMEVTYSDLEKTKKVVLVGFEPEEESPIVFLRLRKAAGRGLQVFSVAPFTSRGLEKMHGTLIPAVPGTEPDVIESLASSKTGVDADTVILVGERMATVPGALSAVAALAGTTGAKLAWVPRRAGDRGAVETGCLPNLLPGGRPVSNADARVDAGAAWGVTSLPDRPGRDGDAIIAAAADGELKALVVGGVDLADLSDPLLAAQAVLKAGFVVNLEIRASEVSPHADVVFPVAPVAEKAGSFVDWEGRVRTFDTIFRDLSSLPDLRVLSGIAEEMGFNLGFRTVEQARARMNEFGAWDGERAPVPSALSRPSVPAPAPGAATPAAPNHPALAGSGLPPDPSTVAAGAPAPGASAGSGGSAVDAVLATWKLLLDDGRMLDGDEYLKATARRPVALVSAGTLVSLGVDVGARVTLRTDHGSVAFPVAVADLPDGVVWAPMSSGGVNLLRDLRASAGSVVRLEGGAA
ncbi:MAG TPA: NADH-quinone oxidoreductase subunit G [Nocardioidaceae bacterium]|nr:NADH-quinone oxidoreductase subunit G [Nocardioidaceae bacterium]